MNLKDKATNPTTQKVSSKDTRKDVQSVLGGKKDMKLCTSRGAELGYGGRWILSFYLNQKPAGVEQEVGSAYVNTVPPRNIAWLLNGCVKVSFYFRPERVSALLLTTLTTFRERGIKKEGNFKKIFTNKESGFKGTLLKSQTRNPQQVLLGKFDVRSLILEGGNGEARV